MKTQTITQIEYRWGMIKSLKHSSRLPLKIWKEAEIPAEIIKAIRKEKILELGGIYGDESWGVPIEYHNLKIITDTNTIEIEFYNLGIAMFHSDDEKIKRIFRVLAKLMRLYRDEGNNETPTKV